MVHNGAMRSPGRIVRQSVSLPSGIATRVRAVAKARKSSVNKVLVELIESGIEAEQRRQTEFFELAERFRAANDPEEVRQLGERMGRMVFGG
jgi:hypothetical protein